MRIRLFVGLMVFSVLGRSQSHNTQRIGDLLIEVNGVTTPATLHRNAPLSDHYWVVAELNFRNVGQQAVCAIITGSLKAEFGLTASDAGITGGVTISELLPGEEVHGSLNFTLKRGANPLELTVGAQSYGRDGCGSELPRSAVRTAVFSIRGVSSPAPALTGEAYPPPPSIQANNQANNYGDPLSKLGTASNGIGSGGGIAAGSGPGSGSGGGFGGGASRIGGGVSAPVPIYQPEPEYTKEARKAKLQGSVLLSLTVDETGKAQAIKVTKSLGLGLDQKAIECVQKWWFKPAMKDGKPVPVMASVEVEFRLSQKTGGSFGGGATCFGSGIGGGVSSPVPIYQPEAEYSEEARKAKWQGSVLLSLVVDETGKPTCIKVIRTLGLGLDEKAIEAVQKWRFKPGMKDGKPVPVMVSSVEVNFRLL
jgi:TonB family protein